MSAAQERARKALKHYLRQATQAAGLKWDSDNDVEVEGIVDDIIEAARIASGGPACN